MQKKKFIFATSGMLAVLTLFSMLRGWRWLTEEAQVFIGISSVLSLAITVLGWIMICRKNNAFVLHCASAVCTLIQVIRECFVFFECPYTGNIITDFCVSIITSVVMCALYFVGAFLIKSERATADKYCVFGTCVSLGALFSSFGISYLGYDITYLTIVFAFAVYLIYSLNKLTPPVCHIVVGICFAFVIIAALLSIGIYLIWFMLIAAIVLAAAYYIIYFAFVRTGKLFARNDNDAIGTQNGISSLQEKIKRLSELNQLKEEGILTEEEYNMQKHKIMEDK